MATLASADFASDDEGDVDFVPAEPKPKSKAKRTRAQSDSESASDSSLDGEGGGEEDSDRKAEIKRLRLEAQKAEEAKRKQAAADVFASMLADDLAKPAPVNTAETKTGVEMVEIERPRQFAGETV